MGGRKTWEWEWGCGGLRVFDRRIGACTTRAAAGGGGGPSQVPPRPVPRRRPAPRDGATAHGVARRSTSDEEPWCIVLAYARPNLAHACTCKGFSGALRLLTDTSSRVPGVRLLISRARGACAAVRACVRACGGGGQVGSAR